MARPGSTKRPRSPRASKTSRRQAKDGDASAVQLRDVDLSLIDLPSRPARRLLGDIKSLAASLQDYGLQQPISLREAGDRFILTSGTRRVAAARSLGWTTIPAFVRSISEDDAYVVDLIENLQRQDLSPEEEADAMTGLLRTRGWTLQQLAHAVKRSVAYISKRVRVFDDPLLRRAVSERGLPISTAEELLAASVDKRAAVIERALAQHWDQTQAREAMHRLSEASARTSSSGETATTGGADAAPREVKSLDTSERPPGLTRAVREFHRTIMKVRAESLTAADRAALRSLFRDLVLLARSPTTPRGRVFPPMPTSGTSRPHPARSTHAGRRRPQS